MGYFPSRIPQMQNFLGNDNNKLLNIFATFKITIDQTRYVTGTEGNKQISKPKGDIIYPKKLTHNYFNITEKIKLVRVKLYILILIFSFA